MIKTMNDFFISYGDFRLSIVFLGSLKKRKSEEFTRSVPYLYVIMKYGNNDYGYLCVFPYTGDIFVF